MALEITDSNYKEVLAEGKPLSINLASKEKRMVNPR